MRTFKQETGAKASRGTMALSLGVLLLGTGVAGCAPDEAGDDDMGTTNTSYLFKDPSTSGPRLDVYDLGGEPLITVAGPIGTETMTTSMNDESLVEIYQALHPTASVPDALRALDARVAPAFAALRSIPRPAPSPEAAPVVDKTQAAFLGTVCQIFRVSSYKRYVPVECPWEASTRLVRAPKDGSYKVLPGDRTYGWNAANGPATLGMWGNGVGIDIVLQAGTWNMTSYVGTGGPLRAYLQDRPASSTPYIYGERGVTWHRVDYIVH